MKLPLAIGQGRVLTFNPPCCGRVDETSNASEYVMRAVSFNPPCCTVTN